MIEPQDAINVLDVISNNLVAVARNKSNFQRLPDTYWGYFAKGHDNKGKFGIIIAYSENGDDIDNLIRIYEQWIVNKKE